MLLQEIQTGRRNKSQGKKSLKKIYRADGNKKSCSVTTLYQTKYNSKQKKCFKRSKDGIFHILKRYSCPGNYNIDPNGAKKLPELHKTRTGTNTKKNKIHNAKGRF